MIFVREIRPVVTTDHPNMGVLDVKKEVGRRWQEIIVEDKASFQAKSDIDKERFKKENSTYLQKLQQIKLERKAEMEEKGFSELTKFEKLDKYNIQQNLAQLSQKFMRKRGKQSKAKISRREEEKVETLEEVNQDLLG